MAARDQRGELLQPSEGAERAEMLYPLLQTAPGGAPALLGADVWVGSGLCLWEPGPACVPEPCVIRPRAKPGIPVSYLGLCALGVKFSPSIR